MSLAVKPQQLKYLMLGAGGLGLALRSVLYLTGMDEKGLLVSGHWAETALWILTAAVAGALFFLARNLKGPEEYRDAYPPSVTGAAGSILAGIAFMLCGTPDTADTAGSMLGMVTLVLRFVSALSLIWVGYCRFKGQKPSFLFHSIICLYFALRMVCLYRVWSVDPQLMDYAFSLGAYVALMLTCYQFAAFDIGMGSHRNLWICGLAALYLCAVSLSHGSESFFLLCCGVWVYANLTNLKLRRRRKTFAPEEGA